MPETQWYVGSCIRRLLLSLLSIRGLGPKEEDQVTLGTMGLHQRHLWVACDLGQLPHFS